jgi:hypothetical protein
MDSLFNTVQNTVGAAKTGAASAAARTWVLGIVLAALVVYILYRMFAPAVEEIRTEGPYDLLGAQAKPVVNSTVTVFDQSQIKLGLADNFTLSFFVYMDETNLERAPIGGSTASKPLVYILGVGDISVDPVHQAARVRVKPLQQTSAGTMEMTNVIGLDVENFMISRWNQLTVTLEGRTLDVYMNGLLVTSRLLENLPTLYPVGVLLETSPDFSGKAALLQAWPRRLTESEVLLNYKRNTDMRGKPLVTEKMSLWSAAYSNLMQSICDAGLCGFRFETGPLQYIDYTFA